MNVHFYSVHPNTGKFIPISGLTTNPSPTIIPFRNAAEYFPDNLEECTQRKLAELCDAYDNNLFTVAPSYHHNFTGCGDDHHHGASEEAPNSLSSDIETGQSNSIGGTLGLEHHGPGGAVGGEQHTTILNQRQTRSGLRSFPDLIQTVEGDGHTSSPQSVHGMACP